jgi:adenylosuccinate synthase
LKNAARLNGLTDLAITKLDVLCGLDALKICTSYTYQGTILDAFPASLKMLAGCTPVYETLPGWSQEIRGIRDAAKLPENARNYLNRIQELVETPISIISVGPGRDETIVVKNPFK